MAAVTYEATIKLPNAGLQRVRVNADSFANAKQMIEMQYGKGCIRSGPNRV